MNVSLSAAGSATIQVGGHVFGFGFPANSVTGTLRISEPVSCASPTYFIYKQNGTNLGALVASGSGSFFTLTCADLGVNNYYFLYDNNGNPNDDNRFAFSINVLDELAPSVTCPANKVQSTLNCNLNVSGLAATITDNCSSASDINTTYNITGSTTASGTGNLSSRLFNSGLSTVTYTSTDLYGNQQSCSFTVKINEAIPIAPTGTCPSNITVNTDAVSCSKVVGSSIVPVYTDNCPTNILTYNLNITGATTATLSGNTGNIISGISFNRGISNVTFTITDNAGGTSTCTFSVTVQDKTPPTVSCPGNITVNATNVAACNASVSNAASDYVNGVINRNDLAHTSYDNCATTAQLNNNTNTTWVLTGATSGSGTGNGSLLASTWVPTNLALGVTTVTYTVRDGALGNNTSTCAFTITVQDKTGPNFVTPCPVAEIIATPAAAANTCSSLVNNVYTSTLTDCSYPANINYTITGATTASGIGTANNLTYNVGKNYVTYTATDAVGNTSTCSFVVRLYASSSTPPAPTAPAPPNVTISTSSYDCNGTYNVVLPTWSDPLGCNAKTFEYRVESNGVQTIGWSSTTGLSSLLLPEGESRIYYRLIDSTTATPYIIEGCDGTASGSAAPYLPCVDNPSTASHAYTNIFQVRVIVNDSIAPSIVCPTNKVTVISAGDNCLMPVIGIAPTTNDNCSGPYSLKVDVSGVGVESPLPTGFALSTFNDMSLTYAGGNPRPGFISGNYDINVSNSQGANGLIFRRGTSTVTYTVQDASLNTTSCSFTVRVVDLVPPTIVCPPNITVNTGLDICQGLINPTPTVRDLGACLGAADNLTLRYQISGVTTLDQTVPLTYIGNMPGLPITGVYTNTTFTAYLDKGVSTVLCTATDVSDNTASCTFTVTVKDAQAPTIVCPTGKTYNADSYVCSHTLSTSESLLLDVSGLSDNCGTYTVSYTTSGSGATPATGSTATAKPSVFNVGSTTVTYTALDNSGNSTSCSYLVKVYDLLPPTITCPANVSINSAVNSLTCTATGTLPVPTATDNCALTASLEYSVDGGSYVSGTLTSFTVTGSSVITYKATDLAGNTATCSFTVTAIDKTPPTISYLGSDVTLNANPFTCEANFSWYEPTMNALCPSATDNCNSISNINITRQYVSGPNPNIVFGLINPGNVVLPNTACNGQYQNTSFQIGTTIIRYNFSDLSGNISYKDVKVTVVPSGSITLTCPSNVVLTTAAGQCSQTTVINDPISSSNCNSATWGASFSGNVLGNPASFSGVADGTNSNTLTFNKGVTTVTLSSVNTATLATSTCTFTVTINDNINPTLQCPNNVTLTTAAGLCTQTYSIADPITDNCNGSIWSASFSGNSNGNPSNLTNIADGTNSNALTFQRGTTNVTLNGTDGSGNNAIACSFSVTVNDNVAPTLSGVPANVTINCNQSIPTPPSVAGNDNCSGVTVNMTTTTSTVGCSFITTRTWTATDAAGNTATGVQTITQIDNQAPTFGTAPTTVSASGCGSSVSLNLATFISDNGCSGTVTVSNTRTGASADASGVYPNGTTTVVFTATDACGNSKTHSVVVTVSGNISVTVSPVNATSSSSADGSLTANVTGATGTVTYLWNNGSINQTASNLLPGTYTVTVTNNGCTAVASGVVSSNLNCSGYTVAITTTASNAAGTSGGSATATPSGSVAPYTYVWSTGATSNTITNLAAGTYTVTTTSNVGCVSINTAIVPTGSASNVQFTLGAVSGNPGDVVNVPVIVNNFTNVEAMTMEFVLSDSNAVKFTGVTSGFAIPSNTSGDFAKVGNARMRFAFTTASPVTLANGTTLFYLQVQLIGSAGQSSSMNIVGGFTPLEVIANGLNMVPNVSGTTVTINGFGSLTISGNFVRQDNLIIPNVLTTLTNAGPASTINSNSSNAYSFSVSTGSNPVITPVKTGPKPSPANPLRIGVGDILLVQKHILGSQEITDPLRRIAADVSKNNIISSTDLVLMKQFILDQISTFTDNTTWRFIPSNFTVQNQAVVSPNPYSNYVVTPFPESRSYTNVLTNITNANFIGIELGNVDLSGTSIGFAGDDITDRGNGIFELKTFDKEFSNNEEIQVPIFGYELENLNALQGTFEFDVNKLELKDIKFGNVNGLNKESFNLSRINEGKFSMLWFDINGIKLNEIENFATLIFKTKGIGRLSESLDITPSITNALAIVNDNNSKSLKLDYTIGVSSTDFALNQNTPNPFDNTTKISFSLPTEGDATMKIVDVNGKLVKLVKGHYPKGISEILINKSELPSNGVYYYQLESNGNTAQRKMIVLE